MEIQEFLQRIQKDQNPIWGLLSVPTAITKENVNNNLTDGSTGIETITLMACAIRYPEAREKVIPFLLRLGAHVYKGMLLNYTMTEYFLERGVDPNTAKRDHEEYDIETLIYRTVYHTTSSRKLQSGRQARMFIDYGTKPKPIDLRNAHIPLKKYYILSNTRVSICRKSLCALLWCVRNGLFPALRGIIVELTRAAWAQRGGEGCGPRGKEWKKE